MAVTWNSLSADPVGRAVLKLTSDAYFKAESVGVAVRNSAGTNLDYPNKNLNVNIGPEGYTYVSDVRTPLPAGTYTVYGCYKLGGIWYNQPSQQLVVGSSGGQTVPGKTVVWNPTFSSTEWNYGKSSAYPGTGPTNTGDAKLDYITPTNSVPSSAGVFNATRKDSTYWYADLATTEYVSGGFELLPGDSVTADVTLGGEQGAWPAIWTWGRDNPPGYSGVQPGHGEVDLFEYHPDNPNLLELSNHTSGNGTYYTNATAIGPGKTFQLRVDFGTSANGGVKWYVNGSLVYTDTAGVPSYWRAWPIVNLSVSNGTWHPAPSSSQTSMQYTVQNFKVWR